MITRLPRFGRSVACRAQEPGCLCKLQIASFARISGLGVPAEQRHHILHCEFRRGRLALDGHISKFSLAVLEVQDTLFDSFFDNQFVDLDVKSLVQPMDTVNSLLLNELITTVSLMTR